MLPRNRSSLKRMATEARAQTNQNLSDEASSSIEWDLVPSKREAAGKKARPRQQPLHLTSQQQDDVVLWYQEHRFLYNKGHADYKLTEKKTALWNEKAEELGVCDGPRLKCWMDSIRTQYGKLTRRHPGGRFSDRDKWILEKFSFLSEHIYRKPNRAGGDLTIKIRERLPEWTYDSQESDEEEEIGEIKLEPSTSPALSTASWDTDASAVTKRKKTTSRDESTDFHQPTEERMQQSSQLQERLFDQMAVPTDLRLVERRQWAQWFGAAIPEIDDSLWSEFQTETLRLVNTFRARSKRVQPVRQEHADYDATRRHQTLNYSSSPWSHSAPMSAAGTSTTLATVSSMETAGPTHCYQGEGTRADVSTCGLAQ